jgi:hypothetical protein
VLRRRTTSRKFEVRFVVEIKSDALPADQASAAADVAELVTDVWDNARKGEEFTDSYNFEAEELG